MRNPVRLKEASRLDLALRQARVKVAQGRRLASWALDRERWPTLDAAADNTDFPFKLHTRRVLLYRLAPDVDPVLEAGKRRNVALAAPAFDGLVLRPDQPLSFWRTLGRVTAEAGYAVGRELAGGCVVPALGGGLCLLSNALFALAALSGWRIVERHAHSRGVGRAEPDDDGLDATVFWPHLDLVVAPRHGAARLSVRVQGDRLRLEAWGTQPADTVRVWPEVQGEVAGPEGPLRHGRLWRSVTAPDGQVVESKADLGEFRQRLGEAPKVERSCFTCGETECHARAKHLAGPRA